MKQTWPMINRYSKELLEGPIQESLAVSLKGFHFERISLGNVASIYVQFQMCIFN